MWPLVRPWFLVTYHNMNMQSAPPPKVKFVDQQKDVALLHLQISDEGNSIKLQDGTYSRDRDPPVCPQGKISELFNI